MAYQSGSAVRFDTKILDLFQVFNIDMQYQQSAKQKEILVSKVLQFVVNNDIQWNKRDVTIHICSYVRKMKIIRISRAEIIDDLNIMIV